MYHDNSTDDEGHVAHESDDNAPAQRDGQPIDVDKFRLELTNVELERDEGAIQPHEQALFLRVNFADGTCGTDAFGGSALLLRAAKRGVRWRRKAAAQLPAQHHKP